MPIAIKAAEKNQGFKDSEPLGKPRFLKGDSYALAQFIVMISPVHSKRPLRELP